MRCPARIGRGYCHGTLEILTDRLGRTFEHCAACERRKRGICADCPHRVAGTVGKALRCERCRKAALVRDGARWRDRDPAHVRALHRDNSRQRRDRRRGGPPGDPKTLAVLRGKRRAEALTPERRREIVRLAVNTRWAKARERAA